MQFEFATAGRIIFGDGCTESLGTHVAALGERAFVVTGGSCRRVEPLLASLSRVGVAYATASVRGEPTCASVLAVVARARQAGSDVVVGVGGGSVLDTGKIVAALLTNGGELRDYLEVVGRGQALRARPVPYVAVPTTAGTGAEATRNAVVRDEGSGVKVSMRSPLMLPTLALVDPLLTHSLPPAVTAATGLDALTQLLEAYVSTRANPITDGICRDGLRRVAPALRRAWARGTDGDARREMSLASLYGGVALANAGLGAVHGLAGPLGGRCGAPHGAVCARLLPLVMEANVAALRAGRGDPAILARYDDVARLLTGSPTAAADDGIGAAAALCRDLGIPSLSSSGVGEGDLDALADAAARSSSMKGNPVVLEPAELVAVLRRAL